MAKTEYKIDWLSFTYLPDETDEIEFCRENDCCKGDYSSIDLFLWKLPEFEDPYINGSVGHVKSYYNHCMNVLDGVLILSDGNNISRGVNVIFSGKKLGLLYDLFDIQGLNPLQNLFMILDNRNCQFSRIDIAVDDYDKVFTAVQFNLWALSGQIRSRCKHFFPVIPNNKFKGYTFYIGQRSSDRYCRIYDKFLESKDSEDFVDSVRYEFELHGKNARAFAQYYREHGFYSPLDILRQTFDIVKPGYVNKSEAPLLPEWEEFLQLKFNEVRQPYSLPRLKRKFSQDQLINFLYRCAPGIRRFYHINHNECETLLYELMHGDLTEADCEFLKRFKSGQKYYWD